MTRTELLKTAKSVIFTTDEVRAILRKQNPKTQFRLPIKPQPPKDTKFLGIIAESKNKRNVGCGVFRHDDGTDVYNNARYKIGDILYVRETWGETTLFDVTDFEYKAGYEKKPMYVDKWKSPATMPKEAARIFLRVTAVRIERLQDISDDDAIAEGADYKATYDTEGEPSCWLIDPWESFSDLWCYGGVYSWDKNPWVWVYEFEKLEAE